MRTKVSREVVRVLGARLGKAAAGGAEAGFHGREGTKKIEEKSIGSDLQIEVEEAMHQDSKNAEQGGQGDSAIDVGWPLLQFVQA